MLLATGLLAVATAVSKGGVAALDSTDLGAAHDQIEL